MTESYLIESVWAKLYMKGVAQKTITQPDGSKVTSGISRDECDSMVRTFAAKVVAEVVRAADWDFLFDDDDESTVVGTSQYTLKGNNDDCADIINIRYGTQDEVLEKLNVLETDRRAPDRTEDGVYGWTLHGRDESNFPIVELHGTPDTVDVLHYRYRKTLRDIAALPEYLSGVVHDGVMAEFYPQEYKSLFAVMLADAIANYTRGGDEIDRVRKDPIIEAGIIRRKGMQGGA